MKPDYRHFFLQVVYCCTVTFSIEDKLYHKSLVRQAYIQTPHSQWSPILTLIFYKWHIVYPQCRFRNKAKFHPKSPPTCSSRRCNEPMIFSIPFLKAIQYRWTWIWQTQWDQENWSVIYIWQILDMHRTGTKHVVRHMQKSVIQWSIISKFTCIYFMFWVADSPMSSKFILYYNLSLHVGTFLWLPTTMKPNFRFYFSTSGIL